VESGSKCAKEAANNENRDYCEKMQFLSMVPLLKRLPKDQHPLIAGACETQEFKKGQTVIRQGVEGHELFVIRSGEASVLSDSEYGVQKIATLVSGDYFGENSLLRDEPRSATIVAETALLTFTITREKFRELGLDQKLQFAQRRAVGGGVRKLLAKEPSSKSDEERTLIAEALRKNDRLQTMVLLDDTMINQLIDTAWKENVSEGQEIIKEGDVNADYFYVVQEGKFVASMADDEGGLDKVVETYEQGSSFGELALLYFAPRAATITASEEAIVWVIDRTTFKNILMRVSEKTLQEYMKYLDRVELFTALLQEEKKEMAKALVEVHFNQGETVLVQGEKGNTFYILCEGEVAVIKDGQEVTKLKASSSRETAHHFGEGALLNKAETRQATVTVTSPVAKALAMDRESFELLLGPLQDLIAAGDGERKHPAIGRCAMPRAGEAAVSREKILRKDLQRLGLLGCGGFGVVELHEHKVTGETYALKCISKGFIQKCGLQNSVMNEKNILLMTNSPFVIKLFETYSGSQTLYFLLEPALGGELYATYHKKGFHGSEVHARYYTAGVVLAFEHLHERRILYRDLKPENVLLSSSGHPKLTDMGLAKFVIGTTFTTCGTPDYFAPELIRSQAYTRAVDWWTLGILIFELMSGYPPFEANHPMQTYSKVIKGIKCVQFPAKCCGDVESLIKSLLSKDPSERLPMQSAGTKGLKQHKWYAAFNWSELESLEMEPPFKPVVRSKTDLANFYARKEDMPRQMPYKDDGSEWEKGFATV